MIDLKLLEGFRGLTDEQTNKWTYFCNCRVTFVTETSLKLKGQYYCQAPRSMSTSYSDF